MMNNVKLNKVGTLPLCLPCRPYYCSTTFPLDKPIPLSILGEYSSQTNPPGYAGGTDKEGKNIKFYYIGEFTGDIGVIESGVKAIKFFATIDGKITNEVTGVVLTSYIRNYYWDENESKGYIAPLFKYTSNQWPDNNTIKNESIIVNKTTIDLTKVPSSQLPWYEIRLTLRTKSDNNTHRYTANINLDEYGYEQGASYDGNRSNINANIDYSDTLVNISYPASYCRKLEPVWKKIPESVFNWNIESSEDYSLTQSDEDRGLNQLGFPSVILEGKHQAALNISSSNIQYTFEAIKLRQVNESSDFGYTLKAFVKNLTNNDNNKIIGVGDLFKIDWTNIPSGGIACLAISSEYNQEKYFPSEDGTLDNYIYVIQRIFETSNIAAFSCYKNNNNNDSSLDKKKIIGLIDIDKINVLNNNTDNPEIIVRPGTSLLATQEDYKNFFYDLLRAKCADYATVFYNNNKALEKSQDKFYFSFPPEVLSNIKETRKWERTCQAFWNIFYSLLFFFGYDIYSDTLTQSDAKENLFVNPNFVDTVSAEAEQLSDVILSVLSKMQNFVINNKRYSFHQNFYQLRISKDKIELAYLEPKDNPNKSEVTSDTGLEKNDQSTSSSNTDQASNQN